MHTSRSRIVLVVAVLAYALLLNLSYYRVEGVIGYAAMTVRDVPDLYLASGFLITGILAGMVMPLRATRPSQVALWVLFLTWLVPCLTLTYHVGYEPPRETFAALLVLAASWVMMVVVCRGRPIPLPRIKLEHTTFAVLLGSATLLMTAAVAAVAQGTSVDSTVSLFDLSGVYGRRLEARRLMADNVLFGYGIATLGSSLSPIAIAYGVLTRRWLFVGLGAAGLLSIFVLDGTKSTLFVPVMLFGLVAMVDRPGASFGKALSVLLSALVGLSMFAWTVHGKLWLSVMFVRRMIAGKATTLGVYLETFRDAPIYMKDTAVLGWFGLEPALDKSNLVGQAFGGGIEENWNGNAWAEMYGDFGLLGLVLASLIVAMLLRFYDGAAKDVPFPLVAAMAGYGAYVWGEAAVTTSILTYGVLVTLLLLNHYGRSRRPWLHATTPSQEVSGAAGRA